MSASLHWAAALIGRPWRAGADGPDAFDCRGLVRYVYATQLEQDVPPLSRDIADDKVAIVMAAREQGWHRAGAPHKTPPREFDVVTMVGTRGLHVGVVIRADMRLGLLHCVGGVDDDGVERGEVIFSRRIQDAALFGFGHFELWRREP